MKPLTRRLAFLLFATALFIATHIPELRVSVPKMERPDLLIHLVAFGGWFTLLLFTEWLGPWRATRSILLCSLIAAAYASLDEFSQALPVVRRTAAWDDLAANILGVLIAAAAAFVLARVWKARPAPTAEPALPGH